MAEQVKSIQNSGIHKLKFNVQDANDTSVDGMIAYIMGPNPQERLEKVKSMLNTFYNNLKAKINGV